MLVCEHNYPVGTASVGDREVQTCLEGYWTECTLQMPISFILYIEA